MNKIFFLPWIGKDYYKGLIGMLRVLVIGASHHCPHRKDCPFFEECTRDRTRVYNSVCPFMDADEYSALYPQECDRLFPDIVSKLESCTIGEISLFLSGNDNPTYRNFTYNLIGFFGERSSQFSIDAFRSSKEEDVNNRNRYVWDRIAFANLAQNFQPASSGNHFEDSDLEAFYSYIYEMAPDVVILWGDAGKFISENVLKADHQYNHVWTKSMKTKDGLKEIRFLNTYHPLASDYSKGDAHDDAMAELLNT